MRLLVVGLDPAVLDSSSASAERQRSYYEGYDVDIVVLAPGAAKEMLLSPRIRVFRPGGEGIQMKWNAFQLLRKLRRAGAYELATVQEPAVCGSLVLLSGAAARLHVQDHSAMFARPVRGLKARVVHTISRVVTARANRVRTVSQRGKRGMEEIGISSEAIDVVPIATDVSVFSNVSHVSSDHPRILTIARLFPEKGVDVLLRAFARLKEKTSRAHLTIVGDGPEKESLVRLAGELKLDSVVEFVGSKTPEEIRQYLANVDVYVQPSRFEGWGMAVVEAAAAGVPIVMTDVGLAGEVIRDGESGHVVPVENPERLAEAILQTIQHPEETRQMSEAARKSVQELPDAQTSTARIRSSLESAVRSERFPRLWPIIAVAFAIRFSYFLAVRIFVGEHGFIFGDGLQYMELAQSLLAGKGFLIGGEPFFFRTAGYPMLLAAGLVLFRSVTGFILFQIVIASLLPLLVYRLGMRLRLGVRASWIAAWIMALEPHMIFYGNFVLTEIVFTGLLLLAFLATFRAMETKRVADSVRAGLLFGLGMFVKPLFQIFPPILFVFFLPWVKKISWRTALKHFAIIFSVAILCMVPWMVRNSVTFGKFAISSQGSAAALYYLGTSIVSVRDQISYGAAEKRIKENFVAQYGEGLSKVEEEKAFRVESAKYISENPGILVRLLAINTFTLWTSSNYNSFLYHHKLIPRIDHSVLPPTHYLAQGRLDELVGSFWGVFGQPYYFVGVLGRLVWLVVTFFFLYGLVSAFIRIPERRYPWVFLVATCAYLSAVIWVDGLGIEARLRFMLMPIEFLYAAYGWMVWRSKSRVMDSAKRRLLVITQRVDEKDTNLAVHVRWLQELATLNASVLVIAQSVGTFNLPSNVTVWSLGKESGATKFRQFLRLQIFLLRAMSLVDAVLVLMVPMYVLCAVPFAFFTRVPISLWYTHKHVSWMLRIAVLFLHRVFSASQESFRLKAKKVRFLGHAIDTEFFTLDSSVTPEKGLVISVGRIAPVKRLEIIIDAVKALRKDGLNVRLQLIGSAVLPVDVEYEKTLRRNSGDFVSFTGGKTASEVRDVYHRASVCVNASKTGSLDKVMLEAMASGCPVVTSNEAFSSLVPKESFVASGSVHDLAKAIRSMIEHTPSREALREVVTQKHELRTTLAALMAEIRHAR
jgi:glycosyltransferase involved in cell wall biosynthesis/4-amino-4-deoxy-L-arabinose transferase-like glycosyltransferase